MPPALVVSSTGGVLAESVLWARRRRERARGLLELAPLRRGEALVIEPARQVHTLGLDYPIDVLFCDEAWVVHHVVASLGPGRITRWVKRARRVVELPAGAAAGIEAGESLEMRSDPPWKRPSEGLVETGEKGLMRQEEPEAGRIPKTLGQKAHALRVRPRGSALQPKRPTTLELLDEVLSWVTLYFHETPSLLPRA